MTYQPRPPTQYNHIVLRDLPPEGLMILEALRDGRIEIHNLSGVILRRDPIGRGYYTTTNGKTSFDLRPALDARLKGRV